MATKSPNYLNKMYSSLFILSLLLSVVLSLPYLCYEKSGVEEYSIFSLETLIILNKLLNIQIRPLLANENRDDGKSSERLYLD